jgi:Ribbon-helix-helix protein, copG family
MHASLQKVVTSIYLDRTMKAALEFEAARDGRSVSGLVRRACHAYLEAAPAPEKEKAAPQAASPTHERTLRNGHIKHPSG